MLYFAISTYQTAEIYSNATSCFPARFIFPAERVLLSQQCIFGTGRKNPENMQLYEKSQIF